MQRSIRIFTRIVVVDPTRRTTSTSPLMSDASSGWWS